MQNVPVVGGIFNVILGRNNPLDDLAFDRPYWLGITVGKGDSELTPRIALSSSPYSLNARFRNCITKNREYSSAEWRC